MTPSDAAARGGPGGTPGSGLSAGEAIDHLLRSARASLDADVAFLTKVDDRTQTFARINGAAQMFGWQTGTRVPATESYCHYVLRGELPNLIPDTGLHPITAALPGTARSGIGSYAGVPVGLRDGRTYGALCVSSRRSRSDLSESDVAFLSYLSRLIGAELDREQAELRLEALRQQLRPYLSGQAMTMHGQPIVELAGGRARGVEALARFGGNAVASPADIFAAADHAGLGEDLELAAIASALDSSQDLPTDMFLSVNASPAVAVGHKLHDLLDGARADRVVVELTEHEQFAERTELTRRLDRLRELGVRIAIDDAGAGYSGLQTILAVAPDIIKLDIDLVRGVDTDPVRRSLIRSLVDFAAASGAVLVAEGIETADELRTLTDLGVDQGQGFHVCRPAAIEHLDFGAEMAS